MRTIIITIAIIVLSAISAIASPQNPTISEGNAILADNGLQITVQQLNTLFRVNSKRANRVINMMTRNGLNQEQQVTMLVAVRNARLNGAEAQVTPEQAQMAMEIMSGENSSFEDFANQSSFRQNRAIDSSFVENPTATIVFAVLSGIAAASAN